jgi:hypothetical protein
VPDAGEGCVALPHWFHPPASLLAALYPCTPGARPSLCPTPISYAATTSEGADYSTGPGLSGTPASPSLFVLLILSLGLLVLEPVLVLLAVGHGGPFEGLGLSL